MPKLITVFGATGTQGGGVVDALLQAGKWRIRAVTRNTSSEKAAALKAKGCEVVYADLEKKDTVPKAIEGAYAIFAVTNFWEYVFVHRLPPVSAGEIETSQGILLAKAAAQSSTLEHYIWTTTPSSSKISQGEKSVPHIDCKEKVDEYIKTHLPELAKKASFLWVSFYAENFHPVHGFPSLMPTKLEGSNRYVFPQAVPPSTYLPNAGYARHNVGVFVRALLDNPSIATPAKYANVSVPSVAQTFGDVVNTWTKVTGKQVTYVTVSAEEMEEMFPLVGAELAAQYTFVQWLIESGAANFQDPKTPMLSITDLGIRIADLRTFEQWCETLKDDAE